MVFQRDFLQKVTKGEVVCLGGLLVALPFLRVSRRVLMISPMSPAVFGLFLPVVLNSLGSAVGISIIGKSVGGSSVHTPGIVTKGLVGIVICEANLIFSMLCFFFVKEKVELLEKNAISKEKIQSVWSIFASGLTCGVCGMVGSLGSAIVNGASSIAIASNPKIFSQLVSLQLIIGGSGALGLIVSLLILRSCTV